MRKKKAKQMKFNNLLIILVLISSIFLIYNIMLLGPIEKTIRSIIIGIIIFINILFFTKKKKKKQTIANLMMIAFILINIICSFGINKVYSLIDSINKNKIVYSSSLIALKKSPIDTIDDVSKTKIGLIDDTLSVDNYIIAKEIIDDKKLENDNKIVSYDDILTMLKDLYDGKIDLMFVSSNYTVMFQETPSFENIKNEVKVITSKDKTVKKENNSFSFNNNGNIKPFSILLMGVDSEKDGLKKNAYANGDGLMILTFNPDTLNITMMSIPRDSYLPISCRDNKENKLTHAGWFGTECMINTIKNAFNIDINYYLKINFKGVVSLVDNLGGVTVDVPKDLCTDNSSRKSKVCIKKGTQTLNGEEALVLARNRHDLALGDIGRGYNQQILIKGIINKLTEVKDVNTIMNILETISNNLDTNLSTNEILSFYNIYKDVIESKKHQSTNDLLNIIQIKLKGTGKTIYFKQYNSNMWTYLLDDNSVKEASKEMKINLGIEEPTLIKEFNFKP